jgi:NAD(P)-dependent dehydrogenase (short-subunit alcohol dehydrogenase family)
LLAVRNPASGERAAARLAGPGSTSVVELDLSDLDHVASRAMTLLDRHDNLSGLIGNAGVMGGPRLLSAQGFERQIATNHLGHAALVAALWPLLHASGSRVVLVSSTEARGGQLSPHTTRAQLLNPNAVRRPAGVPEHQAGQPPVRAGAAPPPRQVRFAGQGRCRPPGR